MAIFSCKKNDEKRIVKGNTHLEFVESGEENASNRQADTFWKNYAVFTASSGFAPRPLILPKAAGYFGSFLKSFYRSLDPLENHGFDL